MIFHVSKAAKLLIARTRLKANKRDSCHAPFDGCGDGMITCRYSVNPQETDSVPVLRSNSYLEKGLPDISSKNDLAAFRLPEKLAETNDPA